MKKLLLFLLLFSLTNCYFSQSKIAIITPENSEFKLNKKLLHYLDKKQVSADSMKISLKRYLIKEYIAKGATTNQFEINESSVFTDTLVKRNTSSFKRRLDTQNNNFLKFVYSEVGPPKDYYYSRKMNLVSEQFLCEIFKQNNYDYIFILNKFSAKRKHWFSKKIKFEIHSEVFDYHLKKIYGKKTKIEYKITKKLYYSAFDYYLNSIISSHLNEIKFYNN